MRHYYNGFIPMTQFPTELLNFLVQKQDIDEFFRSSLETAMNDLLQAELSAFLGSGAKLRKRC